jgi:spermidine synthase
MASLAEAADALKLANRDDGEPTSSGFIFREDITDNLCQETELLSMSHNTQSEFQLVQVVESAAFGKTLLLDHHTQSSAKDEFVYHESLVHPPMAAVGWALGTAGTAPSAKRAFVGGGGELATARELLQHKSFEEVVMVDLDKKVILSLCIVPLTSCMRII